MSHKKEVADSVFAFINRVEGAVDKFRKVLMDEIVLTLEGLYLDEQKDDLKMYDKGISDCIAKVKELLG